VRTYNREDCCSDRLSDYIVYFGDNPDYNENEACEDGEFHTDAANITCQQSG